MTFDNGEQCEHCPELIADVLLDPIGHSQVYVANTHTQEMTVYTKLAISNVN